MAAASSIEADVRGVDGDKTRRFGFTSLSTFGLLKERSHPWVMDLLRALLAAGWVDLTPTEHPVPPLTIEAIVLTAPGRASWMLTV